MYKQELTLGIKIEMFNFADLGLRVCMCVCTCIVTAYIYVCCVYRIWQSIQGGNFHGLTDF